MAAKFQTFDKSPLGVFVQSPLKVRNNPGYTMVIHVVRVSEHYAFFPTFEDWPIDVEAWETQSTASGEAIGFILMIPEPSTVADVTDAPPPIPSDHDFDFAALPSEIAFEEWRDFFYLPLVAEFGKPNRVVIAFGQTVPVSTEVDDYDPGLQEFEDFLFDDEKVGECVLFYPAGRWLAFDKVFRDNSIGAAFQVLVDDFDAAIFEERCRGFPGSWE